ncbi:MAG: hypothetical protein J6H20_08395 [Pyramidobacter sp.]|nr:hypothetical protein [Pyramidobacter sp.]
MLTRIEVSDMFLENARSTAEAVINPPAPLKVWFFCGGAVTSGYMDFKTGLSSLMESVCKNPQFVRKLEMKIVLENDEVAAHGRS